MIAVGIDIGKGKHALAAIDELGRSLCSSAFYTNNRAGAEQMLDTLTKIAPRETSKIGMEATGGYWRPLHDFLVKAGYRVDVINPIVSSASISGDIRGRKTDKGDALAIASVVLRNQKQITRNTDAKSQRLMALTRHRSFLVRQRADMKRHILSHLDVVFPEFHTLVNDMFGNFAMSILHAYPSARALSQAKRPAIAKLVSKFTRGKDAKEEAERLVKAAKESLSVDSEVFDTFGACIRSSVDAIRKLDVMIAKIEKDIEAFEMPELAAIISQIKGSGKLLPKVIAAEFGDISRFETDPRKGKKTGMHKRMLAYAGAEARVRESGSWKGAVHMSKRGSGSLRTALIQIAFCISQNDPHFKAVYEKHRYKNKDAGEERKHHLVALSYVAANLLEILCSLWKSKRHYTIEKPAVTTAA